MRACNIRSTSGGSTRGRARQTWGSQSHNCKGLLRNGNNCPIIRIWYKLVKVDYLFVVRSLRTANKIVFLGYDAPPGHCYFIETGESEGQTLAIQGFISRPVYSAFRNLGVSETK